MVYKNGIMKKILLAFILVLVTFVAMSQSVPTAESILTAAYKQAAKENKNVFVIFTASWCGWCKKMDASMNDITTKRYFDENYVTVHLTVQENPAKKHMENAGAAAFLKKFKGDAAGLPFFVVLDKKGKLLGDSFVNNANMGCPASPNEVGSFIILLKKSSTINEDGMQAISTRFNLNNPQQ